MNQFNILTFIPIFKGMAFSSGLGASTSIVHLLSAGDHIVSMDDLYGGTNRYLRKVADRMNIKTTFVDATVPENVEKAIQENTRVFESHTNKYSEMY